MRIIKTQLALLLFSLFLSFMPASADERDLCFTLMQQEYTQTEEGITVANVFGSDYDPDTIQRIIFLDELTDMPADAWDVSDMQDGSVMAWAVDGGNDFYDLYIAGDAKPVNAPDSCSCLFAFPYLKSIDFNGCFRTDNSTDMAYMFTGCERLEELDLSGFDTSLCEDMTGMFSFCSTLRELDLSSFDTSKVRYMGDMFWNCALLETVEAGDFDTQNVTDMDGMFHGCNALKTVDVSGFDTSRVEDMSAMFAHCYVLEEPDMTNWDTKYVKDMSVMFYECETLTSIDVSSFDTSHVEDMRGMFSSCISLEKLDVSNFDTSYVKDMSGMFYACSSMSEIDVSNFDTSHTENMASMFSGCISLKKLDVQSWDTSRVIDMSSMFYGCSSLTELDIRSWDTSRVTDMDDMFYGCPALVSETQGEESKTNGNLETEAATADQDQIVDVKQDYGTWGEYRSDSGSTYAGFAKDDVFSGWGIYTFSNGDIYEGQFEDGLFSGFGTYVSKDNQMYIGEAEGGDMSGLGAVFYGDDEYLFIGQNENASLNGLGAVYGEGTILQLGTFEDMECVEDGFEYGRQNDDGSWSYWLHEDSSSGGNEGIVLDQDDLWIGIYPEGTSGRSLEYWNNGDLYIGDLQNGVYEGEGYCICGSSDDISYVIGDFENGDFTQGIMKHNDGSWEIGMFRDNVYIEGSGTTSEDVENE